VRAFIVRTRRGDITIEREARMVGPGLVGLKQRFEGRGERALVTHDASLVSRVHVREGRVVFGAQPAPADFVLSVPPRSVVRITFENAVAETDGLGKLGRLAAGPPQIRAPDDLLVSDMLFELENDGATPELEQARASLHAHLSELAPLRAAAAEVGLHPDTVTKAFTQAYGVTPKQYVTRARLFDAAIGLFSGAPIVSAALASGFNDVSRFYAQFRRVLRATPGAYSRATGKRQDAP
jgi:AraC-like DNA-binding protein